MDILIFMDAFIVIIVLIICSIGLKWILKIGYFEINILVVFELYFIDHKIVILHQIIVAIVVFLCVFVIVKLLINY